MRKSKHFINILKMKKITFITLIFLCLTSIGFSQNLKFGHIDSQALLDLMPEQDSARRVLEKEFRQMQSSLEEMQVELNKKYEAYLNSQDTLSDFIRQAKEQEMQDMQVRIQNYQQSAQEQLQKKEAQLFQPVLDKAQEAIEAVGKENGFIYIFDISSKVVLYQSDKSIDVLPLVKKKLGLM